MTKIYTYLFSFICLYMGFTPVVQAQQPQPGPAPTIQMGKPIQFELKNGLQVILVENNKLPRVEISLSIDQAPIFEGDKAGVYRLTELLMGKGTQKTSMDAFNDEIDFIGSTINFSVLGAKATALSRYFERTLELMAEGLLYPNFTEEELEKERAKLLDFLKSQELDVSAVSVRVQNALAYGKDHPYGNIMTAETVNKVAFKDLQDFYKTYFHPNQAYLVIVGDISAKKAKKKIKEIFKDWTPGVLPKKSMVKVENPKALTIDFVEMSNAVQTEISLQNTYELKKNSASDYFPLIVANNILGGGGDGRLFLNLREDKAFTYGAYSRVGTNKHTASIFSAQTKVRNVVVDSAVVELIHEVSKIRKELVTDAELKRVKAKYIGEFVRALEKPSTIASYALEIRTENLPDDFFTNYLKHINAVTKEDVLRVAQKYFLLDRARIVVTGKAADLLDALEKVTYQGNPISVNYYDSYANPIDRPTLIQLPEGVTVATVTNAYQEALGGKDKLENAHKIITRYEESPGGNMIVTLLKMKGHLIQEVYIKEHNITMKTIITPSKASIVQAGREMKMPPDMEKEMRQEVENGLFPLIEKVGSQGILKGIETGVDENVYKVIVSISEEKIEEYYFGVDSGLLLRSIVPQKQMGQEFMNEIEYTDYQFFDGIAFPGRYTSKSSIPQYPDTTFVLKGAEVNPENSPDDFK